MPWCNGWWSEYWGPGRLRIVRWPRWRASPWAIAERRWLRSGPWFSILFYAVAVWGLAIMGSFAWNVTLSVVARLFYYAVACAAVIALRRKQPLAAGLDRKST